MTSDPAPRSGQPSLDADLTAAFVAELAGKSDLVWVQTDDDIARPVWTVWHEGSIALVTGGIEQPSPGLVDGQTVTVILRSKENRARQLGVRAAVEELVAGASTWDAAVKALHPKRLNAPDGEQQPERWARESTVWLLHPTSEVTEQPSAYSDASHRAEPPATDATTVNRTPFHAGRATKKRRR